MSGWPPKPPPQSPQQPGNAPLLTALDHADAGHCAQQVDAAAHQQADTGGCEGGGLGREGRQGTVCYVLRNGRSIQTAAAGRLGGSLCEREGTRVMPGTAALGAAPRTRQQRGPWRASKAPSCVAPMLPHLIGTAAGFCGSLWIPQGTLLGTLAWPQRPAFGASTAKALVLWTSDASAADFAWQ